MPVPAHEPTREQLDAVWDYLEPEIDWSAYQNMIDTCREIEDHEPPLEVNWRVDSGVAYRTLELVLRGALKAVMLDPVALDPVAEIMPDAAPGPRSAAVKRLFAHYMEQMETRDPTVTLAAVGEAVSDADPMAWIAGSDELRDAVLTTLMADLPRRGRTW